MKIYCACCGKQIVSYNVSISDDRRTILNGSKIAFRWNERICGYCSKYLDENGLFPEEGQNGISVR